MINQDIENQSMLALNLMFLADIMKPLQVHKYQYHLISMKLNYAMFNLCNITYTEILGTDEKSLPQGQLFCAELYQIHASQCLIPLN